MHTKFDIYTFITMTSDNPNQYWVDTSDGGQLVPQCIIRPVVSSSHVHGEVYSIQHYEFM